MQYSAFISLSEYQRKRQKRQNDRVFFLFSLLFFLFILFLCFFLSLFFVLVFSLSFLHLAIIAPCPHTGTPCQLSASVRHFAQKPRHIANIDLLTAHFPPIKSNFCNSRATFAMLLLSVLLDTNRQKEQFSQ